MKFIYYIVIVLCIGSVVSMCQRGNGGGRTDTIVLPPLDTSNKKVEESDPRKQANCQSLGSRGSCAGDDDCEDICDDIFDGKRDRDDCEELNIGLVEGFETLIEDLEDGETDIDLDVLECLVDIDEEPIADAVRKMSRSESTEFLTEIAENEDLASLLEEEDDGMILKNLFGSNDLIDILGESDEDENFLYLIGIENNESAFNYLEDYVSSECDGQNEDDADCPGGDEIRAYCKGFLNWDEDNVEDFLDEAEIFADEYEDTVDDVDYAYDIDFDEEDHKGDFLDFCRVVSAESGSPVVLDSCPSAPNLVNQDLSVGQFSFSNLSALYIGGSSNVDTTQDIISRISVSSSGNRITITTTPTLALANERFYLEDSNGRVFLLSSSGSVATGVADTDLKGNSWFVYVADETNGNCEFHVPYRDIDDLYGR